MSNQENYKRTVAGSVGAGMGAIFNGSGRTYYILEHRTQSQFHNLGEAQKIIIDQIEMGRASSCQVRWEDTPQFEMVSRRHAAIVKNGNNYELVHLSTSNPTFVNGQPISGHYYLQSGDEIQLAANGPRMGFIVPQGKQALTSSIRLTERMNLFRQQALAPYKKALWAMGILLLLTIIGFSAWTYKLNSDLDTAVANLHDMEEQVEAYDAQIADLMVDADKNAAKIKLLENKKNQVVTRYNTIVKNDPALLEEVRRLREEQNERIIIPLPDPDPYPVVDPTPAPVDPGAKPDAREYYPSIYRIIVENITIEGPDGISYPSNLSTSKIDCGSGFITPNGTFVTARQNIQPWIYVDGNTPSSDWRRRLAVLFAMGNDIIINYSAYSTLGPAQRLQFSSRDFSMPTGGDLVSAHITVTEEELTYYESVGVVFNKKQLLSEGIDIQHTASSARAYATLPGTGRAGIPTDAGASNSIAGGTPLDIVYYSTSNVQNLAGAAEYYTANTQTTDNKGGTIRLQSGPSATAYGAPVFMREPDGTLMVVGVYVGHNRVVPVHRFQQ
jgi:hypothetical protein